jgi:uncharacterized protein YxeA
MKKILILIALAITIVGADTIKVSSALNSLNKFAFENAQGAKLTIPSNVRTIVVSYEKYTGKLVNNYLDSKNPTYLDKLNAVFIADISEMPSIVITLFALPKIRKYKHTVYLHYSDEFAKYIPAKDKKITIIKIKNQKVKSISYIGTKSELKNILEN